MMEEAKAVETNGVGASPVRREDRRFLTGAGCFTDDIRRAGMAHAVVVRSPHPHARILGIDTRAALATEGVLLVLTATDVAGEIVGPIPSFNRTPPFDVRNRDGSPMPDASQYPLARGKVRYAGEPVAFVVAGSAELARAAAERVAVEYDPLPAVIDSGSAAEGPLIWDDVPGNVSLEWEAGDRAAVDDAFAAATRIVTRTLTNNRVAIAFMEPRSAIGEHDPASGRLTLRTGCQSAHGLQGVIAEMLGCGKETLRVVVPDTGGGFGARGGVYPEFPLVLVAARRLGRPVKWTAQRSESFLTDTQSRDHVLRGALALDAQGHFTALSVQVTWRHGGYLASRTPWVLVNYFPPTLGGVYRIPSAHVAITGVFSNTTPVSAYRGIGRVEATYLIESLVDAAALELGVDPIELRRRNLVPPAAMPWRAAGGATYRSGAFAANLEGALALADHAGFPTRREAARRRGRLRGLGVALYVENDGGTPSEFAEVEAHADGSVSVAIGTQDFGMGHETMYAQVVSEALGVAYDAVRVVFGDTDRVRAGFGSAGSRSARIGGGAALRGSEALLAVGREQAAERLEAAAADVVYARGRYSVVGTDRGIELAELAAAADGRGERVAGSARFETAAEAHSTGCHVCEVEVDPDTGEVAVVRHCTVTDPGRAVNPMIVHGQLHGGTAQGIGQALLEDVVWDPASGQTLSGSFMDYALPRADDLPMFETELAGIPEPDNPLGVKGAGEGATTGSVAAAMNAVRDALGPAGAALQMPATPVRVWSLLARRNAETSAAERGEG